MSKDQQLGEKIMLNVESGKMSNEGRGTNKKTIKGNSLKWFDLIQIVQC